MTWYEVIISEVPSTGAKPVVLDLGLTGFVSALQVLSALAEDGAVPGVQSVDVYDRVEVSGPTLGQFLERLAEIDPDSRRQLRLRPKSGETYQIYFSET